MFCDTIIWVESMVVMVRACITVVHIRFSNAVLMERA